MANEHMKMIGHYFLENYKIKPQCDITSLQDWQIGKIDNSKC